MRRPVPTFLITAALVPLLAGCVAPDEDPVVADPLRDALRGDAVADVDLLWLPTLDEIPAYGAEARDWIRDYARDYANRISFTPINGMATAFLMSELESYGYTVEKRTYYPESAPVETEPVGYDVVIATRLGTVEPERHIGLIAHHDARYSSNEAAYDDGSGTAATLFLARHFAQVDTRKSITVLLFDGEEMGLRSSCYYVNDIVRSGEVRYDIAFGYDMVGMNWPGHDWKMFHMTDPENLDLLLPIAEHVYRDHLRLPEEGVEILNTHDRNSDERRFREAGIPIYRWAGGRNAADYPHYHQPTDTYANMIAFAGSEENFAAGMETVLQTSIAMVHAVDQWAFPDEELAEQDCSFYGPDDGPL